jgi:hypothetical protein
MNIYLNKLIKLTKKKNFEVTKYDLIISKAAIIGLHTKKVLFISIRKSYCCICQRNLVKK